MTQHKSVPSVSVTYARNGNSTKSNELGMRPMQERAYEKRGEQYLLIKSPPASGKSRALMFIALDKLHNQGIKKAIITVPENSIGSSFADEPLSKSGFRADWTIAPKWNLCNSPGTDGGKVKSVGAFLESDDQVLVCTHATFRFAVDKFAIEAFDDCLIAVDEFHHVSANPGNRLGAHLAGLIARNKVHVDIIIALGMAKEGFDWIWCEHALTVGYRSSLTEIVQIIGRATRDAEGKTRARFTNLIAEPDASEEAVSEAVNDTLKAIAASLLMEQVLAPRFNFTPKTMTSGPREGFDYGEGGYDPEKCNVGFNEESGQFRIEIKGLSEPKTKEAERICQEDLNEVITAFVQDKTAIERGLFDEELVPEELTYVHMGKIIKDKYPELDDHDQEAVRQHAIAALNLTQKAKEAVLNDDGSDRAGSNALIQVVRKFAMDVRELDIDLIDRINPFSEAYAILAKTMSGETLKQVAAVISAKKVQLSPEEARDLAKRALKFRQERGRLPALDSADAWEKHMAEGVAYLARMKAEAANG